MTDSWIMSISFSQCRSVFYLLLFFVTFRAPAEGELPFQRVRMQSGDAFHGRLMDMEAGHLSFQPRWSLNATRIPLQAVNYLHFPAARTAEDTQAPAWVHFTNGDRLGGHLLGIDDAGVHWVTRWDQRILLTASMVREIRIEPPEDAFYLRGTLPVDAWQVGGMRRGHLEDEMMVGMSGALFISSLHNPTLSRELPELPEKFLLEFSLHAEEETFGTTISILAPSVHARGPGTIYLQINQRHLFMQLLSSDRRNNVSWREEMPPHAATHQKFQFFMDLKSGKMVLFLNGRKLHEWESVETQDLIGTSGLMFSSRFMQSGGGRRFSGFRMLRWDGESLPEDENLRDGQRHSVRLQNGDMLKGDLHSVTASHLRMVLVDGEGKAGEHREIPLEAVADIRFPEPTRQTPRKRAQDAVIRTHGEGELFHGRVLGLKDGVLRVGGALWEEPLAVPFDELALMQFNVHPVAGQDGGNGLSIDLGESLLLSNPGRR